MGMKDEWNAVGEANEVASIAVSELVRLLSERGVVVDPKDQQQILRNASTSSSGRSELIFGIVRLNKFGI